MPAAVPKVPLLHPPQHAKTGLIVFVVAVTHRIIGLVNSGGREVVRRHFALKLIVFVAWSKFSSLKRLIHKFFSMSKPVEIIFNAGSISTGFIYDQSLGAYNLSKRSQK